MLKTLQTHLHFPNSNAVSLIDRHLGFPPSVLNPSGGRQAQQQHPVCCDRREQKLNPLPVRVLPSSSTERRATSRALRKSSSSSKRHQNTHTHCVLLQILIAEKLKIGINCKTSISIIKRKPFPYLS